MILIGVSRLKVRVLIYSFPVLLGDWLTAKGDLKGLLGDSKQTSTTVEGHLVS